MARKPSKNVRIRYIPRRNLPKHMVQSAQNFRSKTTGAAYKVRLDLENSTFQVVNVGQRKIVKSGGRPGLTLHWLKIIAKRALESLGVEFHMELRDLRRKPENRSEELKTDAPAKSDQEPEDN